MKLSDLTGKKLAVLGLGKTGKSVIQALKNIGAEFVVWDDSETNRAEFKAEILDPQNWPFDELEAIIVSPGVPLNYPTPHHAILLARKHNLKILSDIELFINSHPGKYIGITGTNGKSTTTALTQHIFKTCGLNSYMGGNIGEPILGLKIEGEDPIFVIEISSFQLDLLDKASFDIAALTNITPDHLDRHGGMEGYIESKERIFQGAAFAVIGVDDEYCRRVADTIDEVICAYDVIPAQAGMDFIPTFVGMTPQKISATEILELGVSVIKGQIYIDGKLVYPGPFLNLPGQHNDQNIATAFAIAKAIGLDNDAIIEAIKTYKSLAYRMELIGQIGNVLFVNDSKATNADSSKYAIEAFEDVYWICGGKSKEGGIESLIENLGKIKKAYLIGEAAQEFARTLEKAAVNYEVCGQLSKAFELASNEAMLSGSGAVLLSPACASYDQFKNFEERGNVFNELFAQLNQRVK